MVGTVKLDIGFKGTVTALSSSSAFQRAVFDVQNAQGRVIASSTFAGNGINVPLKREENGLQAFAFGPFTSNMTINVSISHCDTQNGTYVSSRVVDPVTVRKNPDVESPQTYIVSTILSEDHTDNDFNDCIVSVFQFK